LWTDELGAFILSLPKKEQEQVKSMLSTILMMGRSMNCFVVTSVQRASAELFSFGARDNYGLSISMGNISKESASMLGFDREKFLPAIKPGEGHLLLNGTEQLPVRVAADLGNPRILQAVMRDVLDIATR
jgi:DNA segregation ATPase FtsK/SpoIIIE-like protein